MPRSPVDIATSFITAFARRDLTTVAAHLSDDVTFQSPRVTLRGAPTVLKEMAEFAQVVTDVEIIAALGDDDQAMIMYELKTGPFGPMRMADHLTIRDGKITSDTLVFDTRVLEA